LPTDFAQYTTEAEKRPRVLALSGQKITQRSFSGLVLGDRRPPIWLRYESPLAWTDFSGFDVPHYAN
jgi:hypothetical protein